MKSQSKANMPTNVIAIDGPAYVGKSTIAQSLARLTGYRYINTGHMYRAVAMECLRRKIALDDGPEVARVARTLRIDFSQKNGKFYTSINGKDVTPIIDAHEIVSSASKVALLGPVREALTAMQRAYARRSYIVMEGRDIGSNVFPDARWKFFVTASFRVRALRMKKMIGAAKTAEYGGLKGLERRIRFVDSQDSKRKISPLKMAPNAILYDNSDSPCEEQDALILRYYMTHADEIKRNSFKLKGKL